MTARTALAERFASEDRSLKTWVLDVHPDQPVRDFVHGLAGSDAKVERQDASLWRVELDEELEFFADTLTPRFWRLHSWSRADRSGAWVRRSIEQNPTLDRTWLPGGHLRAAGPESAHTHVKTDFGGRLRPDREPVTLDVDGAWADEVYRLISEHDNLGGMTSVDSVRFATITDDGLSVVREKIDREGRFLADGTDFHAHERHISRVVKRYHALIRLIEDRSLRTTGLPRGGYRMSGSPITLRYPAVSDLEHLKDELLSCREPFRLFGTGREADGFWTVEASDLHVGQRITLDVGATWMRAYIRDGVCGNTVVRLAANLEHHLDARIEFSDPELQQAFAPRAQTQLAA